MLVIVAPGQGAQAPGFLTPWLELPNFEDRLRWLSACAGLDLVRYGTEADAETIRDTAVAQPLLVAAGLVSALEIFPHPSDAFHVLGAAAGHSVGEITAAAGTGVISAEQAMVLVRERGRAMADAAALKPTGMTAVLGGDAEEVLASLERQGLTAANNNGAGQVVAAGTLEQLEALKADPPDKARLIPLSVAGAFHTEHMSPAVETLGRYARAVSVHDPRAPLISNRDGEVVQTGHDVLARIVSQVSNPVRWDLCMQAMGDLGVTGVIEVPPAGTLTGLIKRALPGVETVALKTPDDLEAARDLAARHGSASPMDGSPTWRMIVAKTKGTIHLVDAAVGTRLAPGAEVATLVTSRDSHSVVAPHGGTIVEWLVEDGDPVAPGQPIIRLHPEAVHS
ncbi:MAG: [acyl-carrier-protein] S-malonyltransferase [Actinomycetota bacterium]|jgi:[acyl-carrier-protein] S-malonyltransferase|nr:[acyl-carrier-protein] S-malonyltransferase [Actinomycetota bacterium]